MKVEPPAPTSLQPSWDLSHAPLTDNPEAAFEMIAATNLQAEAAQEEPDSAPATDLEDEELPEALEPHSELEEDVDLAPIEDEAEEEEILLAEVRCAFIIIYSDSAGLSFCFRASEA